MPECSIVTQGQYVPFVFDSSLPLPLALHLHSFCVERAFYLQLRYWEFSSHISGSSHSTSCSSLVLHVNWCSERLVAKVQQNVCDFVHLTCALNEICVKVRLLGMRVQNKLLYAFNACIFDQISHMCFTHTSLKQSGYMLSRRSRLPPFSCHLRFCQFHLKSIRMLFTFRHFHLRSVTSICVLFSFYSCSIIRVTFVFHHVHLHSITSICVSIAFCHFDLRSIRVLSL